MKESEQHIAIAATAIAVAAGSTTFASIRDLSV